MTVNSNISSEHNPPTSKAGGVQRDFGCISIMVQNLVEASRCDKLWDALALKQMDQLATARGFRRNQGSLKIRPTCSRTPA